MKHNFIVTPTFEKSLKALAKKYFSIASDFIQFKNELEENPNYGTPLGGGYRKIRMEIKAKNRGKSGGARIISYDMDIIIKEDGEQESKLQLRDALEQEI